MCQSLTHNMHIKIINILGTLFMAYLKLLGFSVCCIGGLAQASGAQNAFPTNFNGITFVWNIPLNGAKLIKVQC